MAIVQLKCPETGKPVDVVDVPPDAFMGGALGVTEIACPHCGKSHLWASGQLALAMRALREAPRAARVLVEGDSATAFP
jgi:hypothetical protein